MIKGPSYKETPLVIEIINFKIESLAFQNRQLNRAHSISDIKRPWLNMNSLNREMFRAEHSQMLKVSLGYLSERVASKRKFAKPYRAVFFLVVTKV